MQEYARRDEWLDLAELDADVETARLVANAEMLTERRENDAALSAINQLQGEGQRLIHAMRIALSAICRLVDLMTHLRPCRLLEKRNALHPVLTRKLKHNDLS